MLSYVSGVSSHKKWRIGFMEGQTSVSLEYSRWPKASEQPRYWLFSADCELCGCSISVDNLELTTRCRIMQRSPTKSVFSFPVNWSLMIFLMKLGILLHLYGSHG